MTVQLPGAYDEAAIRREAARRGLRFATMHDYRAGAPAARPR